MDIKLKWRIKFIKKFYLFIYFNLLFAWENVFVEIYGHAYPFLFSIKI